MKRLHVKNAQFHTKMGQTQNNRYRDDIYSPNDKKLGQALTNCTFKLLPYRLPRRSKIEQMQRSHVKNVQFHKQHGEHKKKDIITTMGVIALKK